MADSFTANLGLTLMENGTHDNTWNDEYASNDERIDAKIGDVTTVNSTGGTTTLTGTQERVNVIKCTGTLVANKVIEFSGVGGSWVIDNQHTGAFSLTVKKTGGTGVTVSQGERVLVYFNGTDIARHNVSTDAVGSALASFSAHKNNSSQTISTTSETLVTWSTETVDVGSKFAANAWTPPAGKARVTLGIRLGFVNAGELYTVRIKKGSTEVALGIFPPFDLITMLFITTPIFAVNGSEAITVTVQSTSDTNYQIDGSARSTFFSGESVP